MAEQEEKKEVQQKEEKQTINLQLINIKNLSDSITELMEKENFLEEDLDRAFELADEIQEKYEDIIAQLFYIRDKLPVSNEPPSA